MAGTKQGSEKEKSSHTTEKNKNLLTRRIFIASATAMTITRIWTDKICGSSQLAGLRRFMIMFTRSLTHSEQFIIRIGITSRTSGVKMPAKGPAFIT